MNRLLRRVRAVTTMAIIEALNRVLRPHDTVYTHALRSADRDARDQQQTSVR